MDAYIPAEIEFESDLNELQNYCNKAANLEAVFDGKKYPCSVAFCPNPQTTLFEDNVDITGEVGTLRVTVLPTTSVVENTMTFSVENKVLKKLIRLAEKVVNLFYHMYRETEGKL